jgi:hypothetical protein
MDNEGAGKARPQAHQKHPDQWQRDLNPSHLAGQNLGAPAGNVASSRATAFHLRKRGHAIRDDLSEPPALRDTCGIGDAQQQRPPL